MSQSVSGHRVTLVDVAMGQLMEAIRGQSDYAHEATRTLVTEVLAETGWDGSREEQGEPAWDALVQVESALERRAREVAGAMSSQEWLWYLARSRWLWRRVNKLGTTAPYVGAVAEAASGWSTKRPHPWTRDGMFLTLPIGDEQARAVMRMHALAGCLYDLHGALRYAGKGSRIVARSGRMPGAKPDAELRHMVRLFDKRVGQDEGAWLARSGLYRHVPGKGEKPDPARQVPLIGSVRGKHALSLFDLRGVPLLSDASLPVELRWPRGLVDLVALMWATALSPDFISKIQTFGNVIANTGYRVLKRETLLLELRRAITVLDELRLGGSLPKELDLGDADAMLERLSALEPSVWPPVPPALRPGPDDDLLVDLTAASLRLTRALGRPPVAGSLVNAWSSHFELSVQSAIDATPWRPPAGLAGLRGRTLRLRGKAVTDVDALAARRGKLLLVSCKGRPYTDEWDRGEYRPVRNAATIVEESVAAWGEKVALLNKEPIGDNYDFSGFRRIVGIVVFPHVPWTPVRGHKREDATGLRVASAASELADWCQRTKW